jgi:hypothetical protein
MMIVATARQSWRNALSLGKAGQDLSSHESPHSNKAIIEFVLAGFCSTSERWVYVIGVLLTTQWSDDIVIKRRPNKGYHPGTRQAYAV